MTNGYKKVGFGFELDFTDKTTRQIAEARRQVSGMENDTKGMAKSFTAQIDKIENRLAKSRRGFKTSLKVMGAGAAILAPFALMTRSAMKAEDAWGDVGALLAATGDSFEVIDAKLAKYESRIGEVGATVGINIDELRTGWYRLQSALGEEMAMAGIGEVAKLPLAAKGTFIEAIDYATSQMKSFGGIWTGMTEAEKFTRIMNAGAGTVAAYNTELRYLLEAMKLVSGTAKSANVDFEETNSLIGELQTRGLQGSRAGAALNQMLVKFFLMKKRLDSMAKGGKKKGTGTMADMMGIDAVPKMSKSLREFTKIKMANIHGQLLPIVDILEQMEKALNITTGASEEMLEKITDGSMEVADGFKKLGVNYEESGFMQELMGDEGSRAILYLLGQSKAIREQTEHLKKNNVLQGMFEAKNRGTARQLEITTNRIKSQAYAIGNQLLPVVRDMLHLGGDVLGWIKKFNEAHPNIAKWMTWGTVAGGALALVGGAAAAVYFKLRMLSDLRSLLILQRQIAGVTAAQHAWNAAIWQSPMFRLLAAIGIGVAAGKLVYDKFLRGRLPGTEHLQKRGGSDFLSAMDAKIALRGWSLDKQTEMGTNIGQSFGSQIEKTLGIDAGTTFGHAAGTAFIEAQTKEEQKKAITGLPGRSRSVWEKYWDITGQAQDWLFGTKTMPIGLNLFERAAWAETNLDKKSRKGKLQEWSENPLRYFRDLTYLGMPWLKSQPGLNKAAPLSDLAKGRGGFYPAEGQGPWAPVRPSYIDRSKLQGASKMGADIEYLIERSGGRLVIQHIGSVTVVTKSADPKSVKREFDKQMTEEALLAPTGKL